MPNKKRKFTKHNSVTFQLVHRSQKDPLIADESAPQHVLVPVEQKEKNKNKEEEVKYGIYFEDDYDYLQHLKTVDDSNNVQWVEVSSNIKSKKHPKVNLPASLFASEVEEDVGLLNKAAPTGLCLDVDPDIFAAMDEDFDYSNPENILEDDFVQMADGPISDEEEQVAGDEEGITSSSCSNHSADSSYQNWGKTEGEHVQRMYDFAEEETKSRFTDYSMSSSVMSRNSQLTLLDERFEEMYAEYDDQEIGALDCDEIEGDLDINSSVFQSALKEYENNRSQSKKALIPEKFEYNEKEEDNDDGQRDAEIMIEVNPKEKWDCESVLSTYSNLYNRPKLIKEEQYPVQKIKVNSKTGIPETSMKLTKKSLAILDGDFPKSATPSIISRLSELSVRDKLETPEERRERKKQIKEFRKMRRIEKKVNKTAFKEEKKLMEKTFVNNMLVGQGIKL